MGDDRTILHNDIYKAMNKMKRESVQIRNIASNDTVPFEESMKMREKQNNIYKKRMFYKNFINAVNNKGSV